MAVAARTRNAAAAALPSPPAPPMLPPSPPPRRGRWPTPTATSNCGAVTTWLSRVTDDFDREVAITPAIDRFCSSSTWILAAASALMPPRAPASYRGANGYFAAMRGVHPAGFPYIEPVELAWGLASPLVGRDPAPLAEAVVAVLAARRDWQLTIITGLTSSGPQR